MSLKTIQSIFLIILLSGCSFFYRVHKDDFYNDVGTWDSARLPLLNPYYLIYIDKEYGWQMPIKGNFPPDYYYYNGGDLLDIRKVAVEDNIVMVYTPRDRNVDDSLGQKVLHWFVMIPDKGNSEIGFDSETAFLNYIQTLGIHGVTWVEPDVAYKRFDETGCFDWIPDCE
jgi:hypothetical protein